MKEVEHLQTAIDTIDGFAFSDPKPAHIIEWHDPKSSSKGWLVIDRWVQGIAGGGIFMWPGATAEETRSIARTMSKKLVICPEPIGGAKAGIRCTLADPAERQAVLWRFLQEMLPELQQRWVTAGDYGTSDSEVERIVRQFTGKDMQWALYRRAAGEDCRAMEMSRRAADLYRVDMAAALLPPGQPHPEF
jgi:glutamate dehydrogenase/leucine dehydrogenase